MDKLLKLCSLCKCGVYIEVNKYRDYYDSIEDAVNDALEDEYMNNDMAHKILLTGNFVNIQFYPDTPVGFYRIIHYDLELALDEALKCFD